MSVSAAAFVLAFLMQSANPLWGTFIPSRETPLGAVAIEANRVTFGSGLVLETVTETASTFGAASVGLARTGAKPPSPAPASEFSGMMEMRRIARRLGEMPDLCGGRRPTHVFIANAPESVSVTFMRRVLFTTSVCETVLYRTPQ